MLDFFKRLLGMPTKQEQQAAAQAAYKVETPKAEEPKKCGCGRSSTGLCVGLHKLSDAEWNGTMPAAAPEVAPAKATKAKAPAKPKAEAKPKAPAKPKAEAKPKAAARTAKAKAPAKPKISVAK